MALTMERSLGSFDPSDVNVSIDQEWSLASASKLGTSKAKKWLQDLSGPWVTLDSRLRNNQPNPLPDMRDLRDKLMKRLQKETIEGPMCIHIMNITLDPDRYIGYVGEVIRDHEELDTYKAYFQECPFMDVIMFGEIHANPHLCKPEWGATDALLELLLDYFLKYQPILILAETFFHLESINVEDMRAIIEAMAENKYPFDVVEKCLLSTEHARQCIYQSGSNALLFLRMVIALIRLLAALHGPESPAGRLSMRIKAIDAREDLGMIPPWPEYLKKRKLTPALVRAALENVTEENMGRYMPDILLPEWNRRFQEVVYRPFLQRVAGAQRTGDAKVYKEIFLDLPDVIAVATILNQNSHAILAKMQRPITMNYAGSTHSGTEVKWLQDMFREDHVIEDTLRYAAEGQSCIRDRVH
jgi:hypothetical protein